MKRLILGLVPFIYCALAFGVEEERPTTTSTTWEIYAAVLGVFVVGFAWVFLKQRSDERKRQKRRASAPT